MIPPMVPSLVVHCANEVEARGLDEVGIYRVPGSDKEVRALKVSKTFVSLKKLTYWLIDIKFIHLIILWTFLSFNLDLFDNILCLCVINIFAPFNFECNPQEKFLRGKGVPNLSMITDIHIICGCLKEFLRSLREPLVTYSLWWKFVSAAGVMDEEMRRANLIQVIVSDLPQPNRDTLAFVILHLQRWMFKKYSKNPPISWSDWTLNHKLKLLYSSLWTKN